MTGIDKQKWLCLINRGLLVLAALLILSVLLYPPWRSEIMSEIQAVLLNARLL